MNEIKKVNGSATVTERNRPLCATCGNVDEWHTYKGKSIVAMDDCAYGYAIYPRAHKCINYDPLLPRSLPIESH